MHVLLLADGKSALRPVPAHEEADDASIRASEARARVSTGGVSAHRNGGAPVDGQAAGRSFSNSRGAGRGPDDPSTAHRSQRSVFRYSIDSQSAIGPSPTWGRRQGERGSQRKASPRKGRRGG